MTVLVTGVFDVLHEEHVAFLQQAKALGGRLLVGLESDVRVKKIKGADRPINNQNLRQRHITELGLADEVFILPERFDSPDDHRELLQKLKPDILAVSSHSSHIDKKSRLMQEIGGKLQIVRQHNPALSSSILIAQRKSGGGAD